MTMSDDKDKYAASSIRFYEKKDRYELYFMDKFAVPGKNADDDEWQGGSLLCDITADLLAADKSKELHIFIWSYGGATETLCTLLQLIREFRRTVAINLGSACSCGWFLFFACDERYSAAYNEFMYHEVSWGGISKLKEHTNFTAHMQKWHDIMYEDKRFTAFLTDEEKKLGETSEVYLTGKEMIKRGACKDFTLYEKRIAPKAVELFSYDGKIFRWDGETMQEYQAFGSRVKDASLIKYIEKEDE